MNTNRELNETDRRAVDQHVQVCATCTARLADYRAQDQGLTHLTGPRPDGRLRADFYAAIGARSRQDQRLAGTRARLMRLPTLASQFVELAIVVLLMAGLGFTLRGWLPEGQPLPVSLLGHSVVTTTIPAQGGEGQIYVVQLDDSLWKLAEKYLGDGHRFGEIVEATRAKHAEDSSFTLIENPDLISPGSKVWIPAAVAPPAIAAAAPAEKPSPTGGGLAKSGSPTGHIAFSFWNNAPDRCTYEINVLDVAACLAGSGQCQATRRIFRLNNVSEPALSPGGDRLIFRGWGELPEGSPYHDCAPAVKARHLADTTLDGTDFHDVTGFGEDGHPNWSPDGQRVLFDGGRNGDGVTRIYLVNADGSNEQDLYIAGQHPSWAPDNQRFVYRGCDLTGNRCGLWSANAFPAKSWEAGINMIGPVVQDERAAHPDWSPVADQIVFQSPKSGSWDLYIANADGSSLRPLTSEPGTEGLPSWSPDGQWVAYLSNANGHWGIWVIRADGSERHLLFAYDGGIYTPEAVEPYGQRDWIDEQTSWSK